MQKKRNTTSTRVERAIRYAFEFTRNEKGDYETVEKYIGFMDRTNFNSLVRLHKKIKQECVEECSNSKKYDDSENNYSIKASEIREIFRQELRTALNELKGAKI